MREEGREERGEMGEFITASNEAERRDPFVTDRDSSANGEL